MAYRKYTYHTGKVIEVIKTYGHRTNKKVKRQKNIKKTKEVQALINEKRSRDHFRRIVNTNFGPKAMHLVLGFSEEYRPLTRQKVRDITRKFFRKLKETVEKTGKTLKFVFTTEYGKRSIHHHVIIKNATLEQIGELWPYGRPRATQLDKSGQYRKLSDYLLKETKDTFKDPNRQIYKKRWCASGNLRMPVAVVETVGAMSWREDPPVPRGYYLEIVRADVSAESGYPYQFYSLRKLDNFFDDMNISG